MDMLRQHETLHLFIRIVRALSATLILFWIFSNIILNAEIDIFQFLAQLLLIILIIVWGIGEPWIYRLLLEIDDCFPGEMYQKAYKNYENYALCTTHAGGSRETAKKTLNILYCGIWFFLEFYTGVLIIKIVPCWTLIFLFLYSTIALVSTYRALAFLLFLRAISRPSVIKELEFNHTLPAATYGFCRLTDVSKSLTRAFLTIMFLFTIAYAFCIIPGLINTKASTHKIIQVYFGIVLLGWLVQFALVFAPKQYFRKILLFWSYVSIKERQTQLSVKGLDNVTRLQISEEINKVHAALKPKVSFFELSLGILTLAINLCGIVLSICG